MRFLLGLVLIVLLAAGGAYVVAGRMAGPPIQIVKPDKIVGVSSPLEVAVEAPGARLEALNIVLEQNGKQFPLFSLADQKGAAVKQDGADKLVISREIGKQSVPELQSGNAAVVVTASRPARNQAAAALPAAITISVTKARRNIRID